jgi:hypothetical protein
LGEHVIEVAENLDRWPGADHSYTKLRGCDGAIWILRRDLHRGEWRLVLFQAASAVERPQQWLTAGQS